ncbi:MAG: hypothetical protein HFI34_06650 [Lachnospiraceae bacterium]|nr:hypothetical protein [Lachnospiraceae bacterium]
MNTNSRHIISLGCILFLFSMLLLFPDICLSGVNTGIHLCLTALMPSIFPFVLISNIIMRLGVVQIIGKLLYPVMHLFFRTSLYGGYAVFMGFFCGYPLGAKVTNDLLEQHLISEKEANRIICFSNNTSPGYLQNYLLISLLGPVRHKIFFILLYYIPIILFGILSGFTASHTNRSIETFQSRRDSDSYNHPEPFSVKTLDTCILESFKTMIKLCGYLIIFSILSAFIYQKLPIHLPFKYFLASLCEITTGSYYLSESVYPLPVKAVCCIAATSFGGFSTLMQTRSVCTNKNISLRRYFSARLLMAISVILLYLTALNLFHISL